MNLLEEIEKEKMKVLSEESDRSAVSDFFTLADNRKDVSDGDFETIAGEEL